MNSNLKGQGLLTEIQNEECILNTKSPTKSKGIIGDIGLRKTTKA